MLDEKLLGILSGVFDMKQSEINIGLTKDDITNWDSLKQLDLVSTLENEYKITLDMQDIIKINSVATICDILNNKRVNNENWK